MDHSFDDPKRYRRSGSADHLRRDLSATHSPLTYGFPEPGLAPGSDLFPSSKKSAAFSGLSRPAKLSQDGFGIETGGLR
jgi:hypothetical protein